MVPVHGMTAKKRSLLRNLPEKKRNPDSPNSEGGKERFFRKDRKDGGEKTRARGGADGTIQPPMGAVKIRKEVSFPQ